MISLRAASWLLLLAGAAVGTLSDFPGPRPPIYMGGYRVLQADFHLHTFPLSAGTIAPWDLVWDARRQGLDAIAVSAHNEAWSGRIAAWFQQRCGGPLVLPSEEIHGPVYHMIAAGIHSTISWRLTAAQAIAEIHRQGGVAIAAHPVAPTWPAYDAAAMSQLDASEVLHPLAYGDSGQAASELREFYARKPMAAIASSDWHGFTAPGLFRTWVFVHRNTQAEILQAIRDRRTVVYDRGDYFGAPALIELAKQNANLLAPPPPSPWTPVSGILAIAGLLGLIAFPRASGQPTSRPRSTRTG